MTTYANVARFAAAGLLSACVILAFQVRVAHGSDDAGSGATHDEPGRAIYRFYCYQCHGYSGDAKTMAGRYLTPPPRDFTNTEPEQLPHETIVRTIREGRPGTAMTSFASVLDDEQTQAVARYVVESFMRGAAPNEAYHSAANGWPDHGRFSAAFPFVDGRLSLGASWESLSDTQRAGRVLFESACVSCHDIPAAVDGGELVFEPRAVSYPRRHYSHRERKDSLVSGASPYAGHERAPAADALATQARDGERLFQDNCAFCHAPDGSGRNWIGSFLEPRPRDFNAAGSSLLGDSATLRERIRHGVPGTSMPAWKDVLNDTEIDAIVAYMEAVFSTP